MVHIQVVELEILYRTIYKQICLYLTKIMKTRLKAAGVQKMAVKNGLYSLKCCDSPLYWISINTYQIEILFLYLLV